MKYNFVVSALFLLNLTLNAQTWVQVHDSNLQNYLLSHYPASAFLTNDSYFFVDAECPAIQEEDSLDVAENNISDLQGVQAFQHLTYLSCSGNQLSSLPELPSTLVWFKCNDNQLTQLPSLPQSLRILNCDENQLAELPELPTSLGKLSCNVNELVQLPNLPQSIIFLSCSNNQLMELPELPISLKTLIAENNQLSCFDKFSDKLTTLEILGNLFTCLPNYLPVMSADLLTYPLCDQNDPISNANGCLAAMGGFGSVFNDENHDCLPSAFPMTCMPLNVYSAAGTLISKVSSLMNGMYYFPVPEGDYEVTVNTDALNKSLVVACPVGNSQTATVTSFNPLTNAGDFGLQCAGFDLGVQSIARHGRSFPGQYHEILIKAGDLSTQHNAHCASGVSGAVTISVEGPGSITFSGNPATVAGNTATYLISDFGMLNSSAFDVGVITDSTAQVGDQFCVIVTVTTPVTGDLDAANDIHLLCYPVVNSHDPNSKETFPTVVQPGYNSDFTYTIQFQNTGNAPAINIRLADTLSELLDLSSLRFTDSSHPFVSSLDPVSRQLSIRFPGIMLADSASDPQGSIGYVQYRINPISNLPNGTVIKNTASIYFDHNASIVTNTSENLFSSAGLEELLTENISLFPNPATHLITIESRDVIDLLAVHDINGSLIKSVESHSKKTTLDVSSFDTGMYFVTVQTQSGSITKQLIVTE